MSTLVGRNLRRLRKQHRLSLEALARQISVSRAMLGQIEQAIVAEVPENKPALAPHHDEGGVGALQF